MTAISDKYAQLGGPQSFLGNAVSPELPAAGWIKARISAWDNLFPSKNWRLEVHGAIRARFFLALGRKAPL